MKNQKIRSNVFLVILAAVLLFTFYGCSTGHDGDEIILNELVIKGTTTSYATDKGTIVFVSSSDPKVIVEANEEKTFPSGAAIVLVERALYANETGTYGGDSTNVYCLSGTYSENGIERTLKETENPVTLTIPNVFSSEYYEFILGYKELNAQEWQYTKLGDDGKVVVGSARFNLSRPSQFVITTHHIGYCYTVFGVKPQKQKIDDINSITFVANPMKYEVSDDGSKEVYKSDMLLSTLVEAANSSSIFTGANLSSEISFYTLSSVATGIKINGRRASESVSLEKEFNGKYLHRIAITGYDENSLEKSGNLATYSLSVELKGIALNVFPSGFMIKSTFVDENHVKYSGEGKIARQRYGERHDADDSLPIAVKMTKPAADSRVSVFSAIELVFSEPIYWSAKAKNCIILSNEEKANVRYLASISDDNSILTIKPLANLSYNSTYTVSIINGIVASGTSNYVEPTSFNFCTVEGNIAKATIEASKTSKVGTQYVRNPEFIINFGKTVADPDRAKKSIRVLRNSEVIDFAITFTDDKNSIASLTFPTELTAGKSYSIAMTSSIKDTDFLDIIEFNPLNFMIYPDIDFVVVTPGMNAENVAVDTTIDFVLSAPISWDAVSAAKLISLKDAASGADFPFDCSYDEDNNIISIKPQGNLLFNRKYQFSLADGLSNELTLQKLGSYASNFKTADSDYTIAVLSSLDGYMQNNILPFIVFKDKPGMVVDFAKQLMDYNYASSTITILKDGVPEEWTRVWDGNKLVMTPPGNLYQEGALYKISMNDVIQASDNSLINPFVPQEFESAKLNGHGVIDNPFWIRNLEEFEYLRLYKKAAFIMKNDLDFSSVSDYEPIGTMSDPYCGKLLGDGKKIINLVINKSYFDGEHFTGLFGMISNAYIASLTIDSTCTITGEANVGAFVGAAMSGTIENCVNKAALYAGECAGGIAGTCLSINIKNCVNEGLISMASDASYYDDIGGIIGQCLQGSISDCRNIVDINFGNADYVGGIVGDMQMTEISDCSNSGNITGETYIGGLAGYCSYQSKFIDCQNSGNVNSTCSGTSNYNVEIGGLAGRLSSMSEIFNCKNTGDVYGGPGTNNQEVGGIVGELTGGSKIICSCNTGNVSGGNYIAGIAAYISTDCIIKNTYNIGNVTGRNYVGGIGASYVDSNATIDSCFSLGSITGIEYVGGILGYADYNGIVSNCYYDGTVSRVSGSNIYFAGIVGYDSGIAKLVNCFSTTDTEVLGSPLTTSSQLFVGSGSTPYENNYVFDVAQLSSQGYDTVIKGTPWYEGSTWNNEEVWKYYPDKLPELKNMPEP